MGTIDDLVAFARTHAVNPSMQNADKMAFDCTKISVQLIKFSYPPIDPATTPLVIANATFSNNTQVQDVATYTDSKQTTKTTSVQITHGVQIGISATFSAGIIFASGSTTISTTINMSEQNTQTTATQLTWSWSTQIPIPPHSRIVASVVVQDATYNCPFTATVQVNGTFFWKYQDGHTDDEAAFDVGLLFTKYPFPGVTVIDDKTVQVDITGTWSGVEGVSYYVSTQQFALDGSSPQPPKRLAG